MRGQKAKDWRLVDQIAKPAVFAAKVQERALELAAGSDRPAHAKGVALTPLARTIEVDALRTDRYLDSLLAAHDRRASDVPADPELDPIVRDTAGRLGRDLVRLHPSFRFEERLAARLAQLAASMRLPAAAGAEGATIGLLPPSPLHDPAGLDPAGDLDAEVGPDGQPIVRPILIGGALTRRQRVHLHYWVRSRREMTERTVSPQRLVHWRNTWYLDAWCHATDALRRFALDAIREADPVDQRARTWR